MKNFYESENLLDSPDFVSNIATPVEQPEEQHVPFTPTTEELLHFFPQIF